MTSSGGAAVTVNSAVLAGTGFMMSGATFPVTLNPGQTATLSLGFDPTALGAATGQLTVSSTSSTNSTATVSLSGTGVTAPLSSLSCSNGSITGPGTDSCTVTLGAAATTGGQSVSLSSSNAAVTLPASVKVAAGATSAVFTASVSAVTTATAVTLTATQGSVSSTFALQLSAAVPTLTINTTSVAFGSVVENTPTTQLITLTSSGTAAVTVNSATLAGTGFSISGGTFPVTLNPGQAATLSVEFDPTSTGTVAGQLTIVSTSSTNSTAVISLSGTGIAASYEVQLTWIAPSGSTDPAVGYNVYRAPGGSSSYQLLNSAVDTLTSYVDTSVPGSGTYAYIVESVDASGILSAPSNQYAVTVP